MAELYEQSLFRWWDCGGSGEAVMLVPERGVSGRSLDSVADALVDSFRVLEFDSWSSFPDLNALTRDIKRMGLPAVKLVSFGNGASLALRLAAEHPDLVERLVLMDPGPLTTKTPIVAETNESYEAYRDRMMKRPYFSPWTLYHETLARASYDVRDTNPVESDASDRVDYAHIECPTLILRALQPILPGHDLTASNAEVAAMTLGILGSRLIELKRHHHWSILLNQTPDVANLVRDFLNF